MAQDRITLYPPPEQGGFEEGCSITVPADAVAQLIEGGWLRERPVESHGLRAARRRHVPGPADGLARPSQDGDAGE